MLCIGVRASLFRNPVWMSRARSATPAFTVEKSAPWMNGKARKKATHESVGKPGRFVAAWSPPEFTAISASGKMSGVIQFAGWRRVRITDRARVQAWAEAQAGPARAPRRLLLALERAGRSSRGTRRRASARAASRSATRRPSASSARTTSASSALAVEAHGDAPVAAGWARRTARRSPRARRLVLVVGTASTRRPPDLGLQRRPGVPSATILPWSMIPTRSARTSASSRYCVVRKTVTPSSRASRPTSSQSALAALRVEPGGRLVQEQDPRTVDEREREVEPPLHPARVAADLAVRGPVEPDALEQLVGARARSARGTPWSAGWSFRCSRPVRSGSSAASWSAAPIALRTSGPSRDDVVARHLRRSRRRAAAAS